MLLGTQQSQTRHPRLGSSILMGYGRIGAKAWFSPRTQLYDKVVSQDPHALNDGDDVWVYIHSIHEVVNDSKA